LLAAGTATVVVEKSVSPTMDEKFWKPENKNFDLIPPVLILRPTRYSNPNTSWKTGTGDGREICLNTYFEGLLGDAYSTRQQRMILPAKIPHKHYDLMLTLHDHQKEALQKELTRQFGITGRREMVETNVLWLQIKNPALLAPHVHQHQKMDFKNGPGLWAWTGFHMDVVAGVLEDMFQQPVIIQAGLADTYDLTLQWGEQDDAKQVVTEKLAQAGLELVPHREPVEMLVVEKVK
jgi:uncharacterized protein (TIGR03435 family)